MVKNGEIWLKIPQNAPLDLLNSGCLSTHWARLFGTMRYSDMLQEPQTSITLHQSNEAVMKWPHLLLRNVTYGMSDCIWNGQGLEAVNKDNMAAKKTKLTIELCNDYAYSFATMCAYSLSFFWEYVKLIYILLSLARSDLRNVWNCFYEKVHMYKTAFTKIHYIQE